MNSVKHKPNLDAQMKEHEMPEYKGKWRNVDFWKDMPCTYGNRLHDTKEAAKALADSENAKMMNHEGLMVCPVGYSVREISKFIVTLQIPVGDAS